MAQTQLKQTQLKIFRGPEAEAFAPADGEHQVTVTVGEVLPLLADALSSERTWLADFEDEDVTISADLYEVLAAYRFFRRPSA
ncbi:MAG: hypothetical protein AAF790_04975 [Planctomycetota bacterium]